VGKGMEVGARAPCLEVERAGATGVHALSGVDGVRPRSGLPLHSVGRARAGAEAGARRRPGRLGWWAENGAAAR
jgi:hypothetical protein